MWLLEHAPPLRIHHLGANTSPSGADAIAAIVAESQIM